jgi:hypothetical protein
MILLLFSILIIWLYCQLYLPYQESRSDLVQLHDTVLEMLPNRDMSVWISNIVTISSIITCLELLCFRNFYAVEKFWFAYALTLIVKAITLYVTPLHVPDGYIALQDVVSCILGSTHVTYGNDLFFSSHTVLMCLCCINCLSYFGMCYHIIMMTIMIVCLMMNRVHYCVDILMAPFVAYTCNNIINYYLINE